MKISKPDMTNVWAEGGSVAVIPSEKISQGWVVEIPPCEQMNFLQNRQDVGIAYLMQQGIPEWDSATEFQDTSYVQYNNIVYKGLGVSTNKQPDLFEDFWIKAFDDAGSAQTVQDQLDAIEADADPFEQYLLETDAAKYGIKSELAALTEINLNIIADGAYQFDNTCANRPFNSGKLVQYTVGTVKYQFSESLTQGVATRTSSSDVFTDWKYAVTHTAPATYSSLQDQIDTLITNQEALVESQKIKVGQLFLTTIDFLAPSEVATHLGYGTWARYGEGRALVSKSTQPLDPAWTKTQNTGFGEYTHAMLPEEMPIHEHEERDFFAGSARQVYGGAGGSSTLNTVDSAKSILSGTPLRTASAGGSQAFNIVQPSIVLGVWYRTV